MPLHITGSAVPPTVRVSDGAEEAVDQAVGAISLTDFNFLLFSCETEERAQFPDADMYSIPNYRNPPPPSPPPPLTPQLRSSMGASSPSSLPSTRRGAAQTAHRIPSLTT
jgi:hypothetical protein